MIHERIGVLKYPVALLKAIVHRVRRSLGPTPGKTVFIEFDGQRMEGDPSGGGILGEIFAKGYHEFAATQCMKRAVKAGMTVIDVGADKGYNTLLAAKRVGAQGTVHAFEPKASARAQIERNLHINGYHNVIIHDVGLFDEEKYLTFEGSRLADVSSPGDGGVHCVPFDTFALQHPFGRLGFVKIDVEGAELNVLKGMQRALARDKPDLLVEVHPDQMRSFGFSVGDLIRFLSDTGYRWTQLMISRSLMRKIVSGTSTFKVRLHCRAATGAR
jgi:FkbM family methyltransferase